MANLSNKAADDRPYDSFNFILQPEFPMNALILACPSTAT
jgi:hypothetical protein